ncbi:zona pellucida sperm-binding protein 4-like [Spea bombifrons]|uniref:zona pellucida sperm-binding protein 4-like n=1 Tax=Spea bombifrons TaxID=233779 RepID=UPI00234909A6|nr:zona pellucida sperm-binding protein 4-like [Spea bombifrons]
MQFTLPFLLNDSAFVLTAIDNKGKSHDLFNSSACRSWVGQKPDGSVVVGAAYDGCYVSKKDEDYVMTISLEEVTNGLVQYHKKDLKCPILPAMDAPSPSVCSAIEREDRLPCGTTPVSRDLCDRLGCCFNPSDPAVPCFYGNKLTAQCTDDSFLVALSKELTMPSLVLDSVRVVNVETASCPKLNVLKSNMFIVFKFPLACSSTNRVDGPVTYENTIEAKKSILTWRGTSITRDSVMRVTVRCGYSTNAVLPLQVETLTLPPPPSISTTGPLILEMRIAQDLDYLSYYTDGDYPVQKVLRDPVYLEVRILQRTDPNLVLVLNNCWANPAMDSTQQPQWPILVDGCPFSRDNYLTQLVPIGASSLNVPLPSHYQRFMISTFTFVDERTQIALGGLVYFHCSASVCVPSPFDSCRTTCAARRKRQSLMLSYEDSTIVTSDGPVFFSGEESFESLSGAEIVKLKSLERDFNVEKSLSDWEEILSFGIDSITMSEGLFDDEIVEHIAVNEDFLRSTSDENVAVEGCFGAVAEDLEMIMDVGKEASGVETAFNGTEKVEPVTRGFIAERVVPTNVQPVEGSDAPHSTILMWLRGTAAVGGILVVLLALFGIWSRHRSQSPRMHSVKV